MTLFSSTVPSSITLPVFGITRLDSPASCVQDLRRVFLPRHTLEKYHNHTDKEGLFSTRSSVQHSSREIRVRRHRISHVTTKPPFRPFRHLPRRSNYLGPHSLTPYYVRHDCTTKFSHRETGVRPMPAQNQEKPGVVPPTVFNPLHPGESVSTPYLFMDSLEPRRSLHIQM